jgi:predicted GNAT family acetyltransferase
MQANPDSSTEVLDNPVWNSMTNGHSHLGQTRGQAFTYHPQVCPFSGIEEPTEKALTDLWELTPDEGIVAVMTRSKALPQTNRWKLLKGYYTSQMIHQHSQPAPELDYVELSTADIPHMIDLVRLTEPGPFESRTIEFGEYIGVYSGDQLLAMAGERLQPSGWVEVSGVCTHPDAQGQGLAAALVQEIVARIRNRGQQAFLNVLNGSPSELTAKGVYQRLGFRHHQDMAIYAMLKLG